MFMALLVSTTIIQMFQAEALAKDERNTRVRLDGYAMERGQIILADGTVLAQSQPSTDEFKWQRSYAQSNLYSNVTGYYNPVLGSTGIESVMNEYLSGTSNSQFFSELSRIISGQKPKGDAVELSLDPRVQQAAADALGTRRGAVVAIEPATGRILANYTSPGFDANSIATNNTEAARKAYADLEANPLTPLINRAQSGNLNPPGSTFKIVVAAAALASGKYTAESEFPNTVTFTLPGSSSQVYNFTRGKCGPGDTVTLAEAIRLSCNVPMAELGVALGDKAIRDMAEKFGFNTKLAIPTPTQPSVYPLTPDPAQTALSAFGQGDVRASPLQMAMVSAAIGNGGVLMKPSLVDRVVGTNLAVVKSFDAETLATALTPEVAKEMTRIMVAGVASGQANNARIEGVDVAGKTGTAQNGVNDPYTLWFTGFAPAVNPEVAVAVVVENDANLGHHSSGNVISSPIAKKVIEAVLNK